MLLEQLKSAVFDRAIVSKEAAGVEQAVPPSPETRQAFGRNRRRKLRAAQGLLSGAHRHGTGKLSAILSAQIGARSPQINWPRRESRAFPTGQHWGGSTGGATAARRAR